MTSLLPAIPEGLKVLRNAHGFNHYFTHLQMDSYGRACYEVGREDRTLVEPMNAVAIKYAHRLALELECVLADRNVNWDRSMNLIGEYRSAMNAIHEQHSPTHMGEPFIAQEPKP